MPGTIGNANHRPVWVVYGTSGSEVNLGFVDEGNVVISFPEDEWVKQKSHQTGNHDLEAYEKKGPVKITVRLLEVDSFDNWLIAFPYGQKQEDDTTATAEARFTSGKLADGTSSPYMGRKASNVAKELRLIPADEWTGTVTDHVDHEFSVPQAYVESVGDMNLSIDEPHVLDITFSSLFDVTASDGEFNWIFGPLEATTGTWSNV